MKIRPLRGEDIDSLREINSRCHPKDVFPDFKNFYSPIVVITDDYDRIIIAGGVESIAEAVTITNREFSPHIRATALKKLLRSMLLTCGRVNQDYLHAFVVSDDETHIRAIKAVGFKSVGSEAFFLEVGNGQK